MSRYELKIIARIMLIGVGLYVALQTFLSIMSSLATITFTSSEKLKEINLILIPLGLYTVMVIVILYLLFRSATLFSDKIIGPEPLEETRISGIAFALRLVCVLAGVMFIYWSIPYLIVTVYQYITNMNSANSSGTRTINMGMSPITDIVKYIILLSLGVYLAYGAPHFVRWQVRMTLKQCNKMSQEQQSS